MPLGEPLERYDVIILVRSLFPDTYKYCSQLFLDKCLHKLAKCLHKLANFFPIYNGYNNTVKPL